MPENPSWPQYLFGETVRSDRNTSSKFYDLRDSQNKSLQSLNHTYPVAVLASSSVFSWGRLEIDWFAERISLVPGLGKGWGRLDDLDGGKEKSEEMGDAGLRAILG
jgi:hypothetical protein